MPQYVTGDQTHGETDPGTAPVKVGGVVGTSAPTAMTSGKRSQIWLSANGAVVMAGDFSGGSGSDARSIMGLARRDSNDGQTPLASGGYGYNGASWDRSRAAS